MNITQQKEFKKELKQIFSGYSSWTPKIERRMTSLGFIVKNNKGKHVVVQWSDNTNKNYLFTISKTPSDKRAGLNNVGIICRALLSRQ